VLVAQKIRRTGAFNDRRLQHQIDEIVDRTNDAIDGIEQTIEIIPGHPNLPPPDNIPPGIPILRVIAGFKMMVCLIDRMPDYDFSHFDLQRSISIDGQATWSEWETIWSGTDTFYSDVGLDLNTDYRYRARSWDIWDNPSDYCEPVVGGKPGKVSLSEEVTDSLAKDFVAGSDLWDQAAEDLVTVRAQVVDNTADISVIAQKTDEISSTVAKHERTTLLESTVTSYNATAKTLTDTSKDFTALTADDGQTLLANLKGFMVAMLDGPAQNEVRTVVGSATNTLTLDSAFDTAPVAGNSYRLAHPSLIASSTFQQQADSIEMRVMGIDKTTGQPVPNAQLKIGQVDENGYVLISADDIILDGTIRAKKFAQLRNTWQVGDVEPLDSTYPIEFDFWLPSELTQIVSVKLHARAVPFRAYAKTASAGGSHTHTVDIPGHKHDMPAGTTTQDYTTYSASTATVNQTPHGHSSGTLSIGSSTHSHSCGSAGNHSHGAGGYASPAGDPSHSHSVTVTVNTESGHSHSIGDSSHTHGISGGTGSGTASLAVDLSDHRHAYTYWAPGSGSTTGSGGASVPTSSSSGDHEHDLVYGIYQSTTPAGVNLYCDNGSGYGSATALNGAPDTTTPYELTPAGGLDLTAKFASAGRKRIKFTTTRLGRINYQIFIKADLEVGGGL
jgi:hypothetical protein